MHAAKIAEAVLLDVFTKAIPAYLLITTVFVEQPLASPVYAKQYHMFRPKTTELHKVVFFWRLKPNAQEKGMNYIHLVSC